MKINDLHEGIWDALKTGARDWAISRGLGGQERQIQQKMAQYTQTRQAAATAQERAKQAAYAQKDQANLNAMINDLPKKILQGIQSNLITPPVTTATPESIDYDYNNNFDRLMENKSLLTEAYNIGDFIYQWTKALWPTVSLTPELDAAKKAEITNLWGEFIKKYSLDPRQADTWSNDAKKHVNNIAQIYIQARELGQQRDQQGKRDTYDYPDKDVEFDGNKGRYFYTASSKQWSVAPPGGTIAQAKPVPSELIPVLNKSAATII